MRIAAAMLMFLFFSGLSSCGNKDGLPPGILKPAAMEAVLWDVIRADAYTTDFIRPDSSKNAVEENAKLQKMAFAIHKVSKEDFYKSLDYYKKNSTLFKPILDSIIARAGRNRNVKLIQMENKIQTE
jgi:hypothetical protein